MFPLIGFAAGCTKGKNSDFVPPEARAQEFLNQALTSWKNGKPPGVVQESGPRIDLHDTHFKPGQTLADFTILGPTAGDADRCFAVRLKFANPVEEVRVRYVVFGADPISVMRYEDYEMLSHWDHGDHGSSQTTGAKKP
jgi:hypothetical protein